MSFITIFTPTYNRGYILPQLYKSLCKQTDSDFSWLIVDDGSSDNTSTMVHEWIQEKKIDITYVYQKNAGKHVAHNHGVELCQTPLFICVDSDDILAADAVKTIHSYWEQDKANYNNFMGYCTKRGGGSDKTNKDSPFWPAEDSLVWAYELGEKYHYRGETGLVWITDHLKKYHFPVIPGERFVTEIVLYYQFSKPMKIKNDVFYFFTYQPDGYTKSGFKLQVNNPKGTAIAKKVEALFSGNFFRKLKGEIKYQGWITCFNITDGFIDGILSNYNFSTRRIPKIISLTAWILRYPCAILYKRKIYQNDR